MQTFRTPSLTLQTPDEWLDKSTYVLMGPDTLGFRPSVVVNVSPGVLDPYLRRHVDIQLNEMQQKLAGFMLFARSEPFRTPYGEAITVEFDWSSPEAGTRLHQYQMYFYVNQTIYTLTGTAASTHWTSLGPLLIRIISSFQPGQWGPELAVNRPG